MNDDISEVANEASKPMFIPSKRDTPNFEETREMKSMRTSMLHSSLPAI